MLTNSLKKNCFRQYVAMLCTLDIRTEDASFDGISRKTGSDLEVTEIRDELN